MKQNKKQSFNSNSNGAMIQPQAPEIERAVLGALLIDNEAYDKINDWLSPKIFYEPCNQTIAEAIQNLKIKDKPIDILTVTEELNRMGKLEEIGGPSYVAELTSRTATSANVEYHIRIVAQKYLLRQLNSFFSEGITMVSDPTTDCDDLLQFCEGRIFELAQRNIKKDYVHVNIAVKESCEKMMKAYSNKGELTGISTGFNMLDENTDGWQNSDLVILAGRPSMGKTSFALSILKNAAVDRRIPSAFFSLEMSRVQLADRLISNVTDIEVNKISRGQISPQEIDLYDKRLPPLLDAPIYIDDTPGLSILELRTKARRLVREKGVRLIMIDYLQLMNAGGIRFSSRQEEVSIISRSLKGLAKELDIPIIALSQLNRGVESREGLEGKRPQLSDLRESGAIEQDADMVIFVHRPEYYHIYNDDNGRDLRGMVQIIIAKHRKGATGDVLLTFRGEYTRFENPEDNTLKDSILLSDLE